MKKRSSEPFFWLLFSGGGVMSALVLPALLLVFGVAVPLGLLSPPSYDVLRATFDNVLAKLLLTALCPLALFHGAHRFRYTLYDGLQIKHLNELINTACYGGAVAGSLIAWYVIWTL